MVTHIIAKTLVFDHDGKLLLLTRSKTDRHRPGGLDLPGGKMEEAEDVRAGVAREALEESGLIIKAEDLEWVYADTVANFNTDAEQAVNMVRITFAARLDKPKVKLSFEHDDFSWHMLDEALELLTGTRYIEVLTHMTEHDIAHDVWSPKV